MFDSIALLAVARRLADPTQSTSPDAHLRRAISTAYYALFHHVLTAAADRFVGAGHGDEAAYAVIYRGFAHRRIAEVCRAIDRDVLTAEYTSKLGRPVISSGLRRFGLLFVDLQTYRHAADYDPHFIADVALATTCCDLAEAAMTLLDDADRLELTSVFALMSVNGRG